MPNSLLTQCVMAQYGPTMGMTTTYHHSSVVKPDILKPDILYPDVLWVYQLDNVYELRNKFQMEAVLRK